MEKVIAKHYVQKPGGGVAAPGEVLPLELVQKFTSEQLERLIRLGAILIEYAHDEDEVLPIEELELVDEAKAPEQDVPQVEAEEIEPEPMEINAMDGIVQNSTEKPKRSAGRRKGK